MKIAQVLVSGASEYERKSQRVDFAALSPAHDVIVLGDPSAARDSGAEVMHVYGPPELPAGPFVRFPIPYIASGDFPRKRFALRRPTPPEYVVTPLRDTGGELLPEAVEEGYFDDGPLIRPSGTFSPQAGRRTLAASVPRPTQWGEGGRRPGEGPVPTFVVGSFRRPGLDAIVQQTMARISRFRDEVVWHVYDHPPTPADLADVDVWVDPALREDDFDGFVAEALAAGRVVVASRTAINLQRTEKGRTGLLVPQRDPNELTHAILAALFKPEVAQAKMEAARQTLSKFRPRQRLRVLSHIYDSLIGNPSP